MKKNCFLILFFITLLNYALLAQEFVSSNQSEIVENKFFEEETDKLIGIDFHFLGTSFHYSKKIKENLFWGIEGGFLPDLYDWIVMADRYISEENTIWSGDKSEAHLNSFNQLLFGHLFIRLKPKNQYFEIDTGIRAAVYSRSGSEVDDLGLTNLFGGYIKPAIGNKRIKVGVRLDFGIARGRYYGPFNEFVIIASPLIRFNLKRT